VRAVDGSLLDEWDRLNDDYTGDVADLRAAELGEELAGDHFDVTSDHRAFRAMVRSELFRWVQLLSRRAWRELGELDWEDGRLGPEEWAETMEQYWPEFEEIAIDANARGPAELLFRSNLSRGARHPGSGRCGWRKFVAARGRRGS
jgi:hypothetical protein